MTHECMSKSCGPGTMTKTNEQRIAEWKKESAETYQHSGGIAYSCIEKGEALKGRRLR